VLGVAGSVTGTVVGVVLAQRRSDRREDVRWARERVREREGWAREDARRTFDQRRDCYIDFLQNVRKAALAAYNAGYELGQALESGWNLPLYESLLRLLVFASPEAAKAAEEAYDAVWTWGDAGGTVNDARFHDGQDRFDAAETNLLAVVRADLGVEAALPTRDYQRDEPDA
jgi:hypothetical protein